MSAVEKEVATQIESSDEPTLRETLEAAVKEHTEPKEESVPRETSPEERVRDESGRFASKEVKEPEPVVPEPAEIAAPRPSPEVTAPAPNSWDTQAKAEWAKLPPMVQAQIAKREADVHRQFTKMDEERVFAKQMQQATAPYEAMIRAQGANIPQAVSSILNTAYILASADQQTKAQEIARVCQQYGIDLNLVANPPQIDPQYQAMQTRLQQLETERQQEKQAAAKAVEDQVFSLVETFGQDPKHTHFQAVRTHMGALMQAGEAKSLDEAYDMAIWARPDLRASLLAPAQQAVQTQHTTQNAKRKAVSVRGGPGGIPPIAVNPNATVRDDLMAAMEEVRGRV